MERLRWLAWGTTALLLLGAGGLAGCGCANCDDALPGGTPPPAVGVKPDFLLLDVNPNSVTYQGGVSPRQHLTRVSAWYFGHAT